MTLHQETSSELSRVALPAVGRVSQADTMKAAQALKRIGSLEFPEGSPIKAAVERFLDIAAEVVVRSARGEGAREHRAVERAIELSEEMLARCATNAPIDQGVGRHYGIVITAIDEASKTLGAISNRLEQKRLAEFRLDAAGMRAVLGIESSEEGTPEDVSLPSGAAWRDAVRELVLTSGQLPTEKGSSADAGSPEQEASIPEEGSWFGSLFRRITQAILRRVRPSVEQSEKRPSEPQEMLASEEPRFLSEMKMLSDEALGLNRMRKVSLPKGGEDALAQRDQALVRLQRALELIDKRLPFNHESTMELKREWGRTDRARRASLGLYPEERGWSHVELEDWTEDLPAEVVRLAQTVTENFRKTNKDRSRPGRLTLYVEHIEGAPPNTPRLMFALVGPNSDSGLSFEFYLACWAHHEAAGDHAAFDAQPGGWFDVIRKKAAVGGIVRVRGQQLKTLLWEGSFDEPLGRQISNAASLRYRLATRKENRAYLDSLLAREKNGSITDPEKVALTTYRERFVRDHSGELYLNGRAVRANNEGRDDAHPKRGALFVREMEGSMRGE